MPNLVSKERMCDSIDLILTMQNPSGGFASYELIRGPALLEQLNPAEVFGTSSRRWPEPSRSPDVRLTLIYCAKVTS